MPTETRTPPNANGEGAGGANPEAAPLPPQNYALRCAVKESHGHPIYCVAFSRHLHASDGDGGAAACFATCGGPFAAIYETTGGRDGGGGAARLVARQVYRDADDGEAFYTCAFGGRGAGSPAGYAAVGVAAEDGIIYFGDDAQQPPRADANGPAKRRKPPDAATAQTAAPPPALLPVAAAAPDGPPLLCLAGTRGVIKVVDTVRRALALTLSGHGSDVTDLKVSPADEHLLLSASKDESVRLWNLRTGTCAAAFAGHAGHRGQVLGVAWHPRGARCASCGMDNTVKLWRVRGDGDGGGGVGEAAPPVERAVRRSFAVTPDDWREAPAAAGGGGVRQTKRFRTVFHQFPYFSTNEVHTNYVDCVQFVGDLILSKSVSNKVVLWKPLVSHEDTDGNDGGTADSTIRIPSSILFLRDFELERCDSWYIRFDSSPPRHRLLALGNQAGDVKVWHVGGGPDGDGDGDGCHPRRPYFCSLPTAGGRGAGDGAAPPATVRMVAFNPHGSQLVAVREDATVWMWDAV